MGGKGSGTWHKTWTTQALAAHRKQLDTEAKQGLDLHWRSLTPAEIQREYTTWKLARLLSAVNHQHDMDRLCSQVPINPDAYSYRA